MTNRIKKIEAKWLPFLLTHNLATPQDIADARARRAQEIADIAKRTRKPPVGRNPEETSDGNV